MKKAIIYCRVSSSNQAEKELPIESQLDACRKKAKDINALVVNEFFDSGISGTTDKRKDFQKAISFVVNNDIDYLITWSSSRFARNRTDAIIYKGILKKNNTDLIYVNANIDLDSKSGFIIDGINELMDELYSRQVSEDTKRSLMKNARLGYRNGGRAPFGYQMVVAPDNPKKKVLTPHPLESLIVKDIYNYRLQGFGTKSIATLLNEKNILNRNKLWQKNTILYLLQNEAYVGFTIYNKTNNKTKKTNPESEWVRVKSHTQIISDSIFSQTQCLIDQSKPKISNKIKNNTSSIFTSMMHCECGSLMTTETATGRSKRYKYYICGDKKRGKTNSKNHTPRIQSDKFDAFILSKITQDLFSISAISDIINKIKHSINKHQNKKSKVIKSLQKELTELKNANENLWRVLEQGGPDDKQLVLQRIQNNNLKIQNIKKSIEPQNSFDGEIINKVEPEQISKHIQNILKNAPVSKLRAFLSGFLSDIVIKDDVIKITYNPSKIVRVRSKRSWLPELGSNQRQTD